MRGQLVTTSVLQLAGTMHRDLVAHLVSRADDGCLQEVGPSEA